MIAPMAVFIMTVLLQQPSAGREPFNSQGIVANSPLSRSHSRAAEHLVLVPAMKAPYIHRKNSIEKCTMSADILLTICTEALVLFGALEHPNLCEKVCCGMLSYSIKSITVQGPST